MPLPNGCEVQQQLITEVSEQLHSGEYFVAARLVAKWMASLSHKSAPQISTKKDADTVLSILLHWCLDNEGYLEAAQMLWSKNLFDGRPNSTQRVWKGFEESKLLLLQGAGSMSKSYSMGVRLMLEWIRDPEYTTVQVLGPSEDHLEKNLFSHLVALHQNSTIPLPGETGKLFIGLDPRNRKSSITGVVIPIGKKKSGRLQGSKRVGRVKPHPVFGPTSRMLVFLDEIANIPSGIWGDIDNLLTGMGDGILKIIGAYNPDNRSDEVGIRAEPQGGWEGFNPETDFEWESTRGWKVIRLDAHQCENVVEDKVIFPGLQTREGLRMLAKNNGGSDSPGYWKMARGCFPPSGALMTIIPTGMLADIRAEIIWYERPIPIGAVDTALKSRDICVFAKGSFGQATGVKFPPTSMEPNWRTVMFKNARGINITRPMVHLESFTELPKGDTVAMTASIIKTARQFQIQPHHLCIDKTGNGVGVFDLLTNQFGSVIGVNFSQSSSESKIMVEDQENAKELYDRVYSELWFALRKFIEFGYAKISPSVETEPLFTEVTDRHFRSTGKKSRVEEKEDYALRHQDKSPDHADAWTLLILGARRAFSLVISMLSENSSTQDDDDDNGEFNDTLGGVRIDVTNRTQSLD